MARVFNFSAGPATLPEEVLRQAAEEMLDWGGTGQSVMEMSHRGKDFMSIAAAAEADLRELLGIPDYYRVLFLQGGASLQFEMIPMNLLRGRATADYVNTGEWAKKAIKAARGLADVHVAASSEDRSFTYVPGAGGLGALGRRRVRALHGQRDDRRRRVRLGPPDRRRAAGLRHVVQHRLPAGRGEPVRADLRRRAEEHRPGRADHRHHPRRPDRASAIRCHRRCWTTPPTPRPTRCTTPRRRTRSTSPGWSSSGCWRPAGWPAPSSATSPRPPCSTTIWTAPTSTPTRSSAPTGRG